MYGLGEQARNRSGESGVSCGWREREREREREIGGIFGVEETAGESADVGC